MQSALHGSHRNAEHIRRLAIFHALVIDENQRTLQRVGKFLDGRSHPVFRLVILHLLIGRLITPREHLHERTNVVISARAMIEESQGRNRRPSSKFSRFR